MYLLYFKLVDTAFLLGGADLPWYVRSTKCFGFLNLLFQISHFEYRYRCLKSFSDLLWHFALSCSYHFVLSITYLPRCPLMFCLYYRCCCDLKRRWLLQVHQDIRRPLRTTQWYHHTEVICTRFFELSGGLIVTANVMNVFLFLFIIYLIYLFCKYKYICK